MVNKRAVAEGFGRAAKSYDAHAIAQQQIADKLTELINNQGINPNGRILEIGCGTGILTRQIASQLEPSELTINDISPDMGAVALKSCCAEFICADAEEHEFKGHYDLIVSSSTVQWFNNQGRFINKMASILNPNGVLAISTFGPKTLNEVTSLSGKGLNYMSISELKALFEASTLSIETLIEQKITLHFDSAIEVLKHLQSTGVNNTSPSRQSFRETKSLIAEYEKLHRTESGVELSYHPIYIICTKKSLVPH